MSNTSLINKTRVKKRCIQIANDVYDNFNDLPDTRVDSSGREWNWRGVREARTRGKFTQVSQSLLEELDTQVRKLIYERVTKHKQTGKTVK